MNLRRLFTLSFATASIVLGLTAPLRAQKDNGQPLPDTDPEFERKSFKIADGFEINLFASDPMIQKPIEMNWDNRGRLWCATSEMYPQLVPGQVPNDKIFILEDTTGSGKADKSTVFADGLMIPNAVIPGDGGAYVTNSTEILFLKDSKGGNRADTRRVVLAGFGTEDTHHIVHTLRWGNDGKLYFLQSLYIHAHLETPTGLKTLLASGVWRYDTRTLDLGVYSRGLVNPWGIVWDKWGQTFETDGAGGQGINYAFTGASFESAVGADRLLPGLNPRSPKYCSEEILSGRHIPENYRGDILTNDFRANRIVRFKLSDDGSGYSSRQMRDFLTSTDSAFRPVDIKMGPDGAIYIADWYNPIIQHGEVDFRDPRRDHTHGRIWRVTAKGRPLVDRPKIAGESIPALLELLKSPEDYTRHQARLTLREKDAKDVLAAVNEWAGKLSADDDHSRLEALWTCENINSINTDLLTRVLKSTEPKARAAAVRVAAHWAKQLPDFEQIVEPLLADAYPRVRLEAVRALSESDKATAIVSATRVLNQPMDSVLDYALWLTCNDLAAKWVPAFKAGQLANWETAHRNFALRAVKSPEAVKVLVEELKSGAVADPAEVELIADLGNADDAGSLFELALRKHSNTPDPWLLDGLLRMSSRHIAPPANAHDIAALLENPDPSIRAGAMRLAGAWKIASARGTLIEAAETEKTDPAVRSAAVDGLARLRDDESVAALRRLAAAPQPQIRHVALSGLASVDLKGAVKSASEMLVAGDEDPAGVLGAILSRDGGAAALNGALQSAKIPRDTARLSLRYLQSSTTQDPKLMGTFSTAAGMNNGPVRLTAEQMQQTIAEVMEKGDASRGEKIFRRADTDCYQCHAIAGTGGWLAPDLSGIGASAPMDYLINAVLDPNKDIKDGYDGFAVATKSGAIFSGIKTLQDSAHIVLRDNEHQQISIPLSDVRAQKSIGSLMPNGLSDPLTRGEFLDLIRFLSALGKPGPYGPSTAQYVRRWTTDSGRSVYALFSGEVPADAVNGASKLTATIDIPTAGKVGLQLADPTGLELSIDSGAPAPAQAKQEVELSRGQHTITLKLGATRASGAGIKVELTDLAGSNAHATAVGGK